MVATYPPNLKYVDIFFGLKQKGRTEEKGVVGSALNKRQDIMAEFT